MGFHLLVAIIIASATFYKTNYSHPLLTVSLYTSYYIYWITVTGLLWICPEIDKVGNVAYLSSTYILLCGLTWPCLKPYLYHPAWPEHHCTMERGSRLGVGGTAALLPTIIPPYLWWFFLIPLKNTFNTQ